MDSSEKILAVIFLAIELGTCIAATVGWYRYQRDERRFQIIKQMFEDEIARNGG